MVRKILTTLKIGTKELNFFSTISKNKYDYILLFPKKYSKILSEKKEIGIRLYFENGK